MNRDPRRVPARRARVRFESLEARRLLAGFVVTNTLDSGPGSLRQAILDADAGRSAGAVAIDFAIPGGGVHTIAPNSSLPAITRPVTLDGSTQPGDRGRPLVELDGSLAGMAAGLTLAAGSDGSTVRGLAVDRFRGDGISLRLSSNVAILGDYVGVAPDGESAAGNGGGGITLVGSSATIGGTASGAGVVVSANRGDGISLRDFEDFSIQGMPPRSGRALILGSFIGTDAGGSTGLGNGGSGVVVQGAATIGGATPGAVDVISANGGAGIRTLTTEYFPPNDEGAKFTSPGLVTVQGDRIGTDRSGARDLGNGGAGVDLSSAIGAFSNASGFMPLGGAGSDATFVGGTASGAGNAIAFNRGGPIAGVEGTIVGNRFGVADRQAHLGVVLAGSAANVERSDPVPFTITVANRGPADATRVLLLLDPGFAPPTFGPGPATPVAGADDLYQIPRIAAGASAVIRLTLPAGDPADPGHLTARVVGLDQVDPDSRDGSASTIYTGLPDLSNVSIRGAISPASPEVDRVATATITATNSGTETARDLKFDPHLISPGGAVVAVRSSRGTPPSPADFNRGGPIVASLGDLAPGASATLAVDYLVGLPGRVTLTSGFSTIKQYDDSSGQIRAQAVAVPTFRVTNALDSGPGSLRRAILDADADADPSPGVDLIGFAIPGGGVRTIAPSSALPAITRPVRLDGSSQPGYVGNFGGSFTFVTPPRVALDGSHAGMAAGLTLAAGSDGSMILALAVDRFRGDGIDVTGASGVTVQGCDIGVDPGGTVAEGNVGDGILLAGSPGATIGGVVVDDLPHPTETQAIGANTLSANGGYGVATRSTRLGASPNLTPSSMALIRGNRIGTDSSGTRALGNALGGIFLDGGNARDTIGGADAGQGNVISGNGGDGISEGYKIVFPIGEEEAGVAGDTFQGNFIGTDPSATVDLGNRGEGIRLGSLGGAPDTVGGTAAGAGNTFGFNRGPAVDVTLQNLVVGNRLIGGPPAVVVDLSVAGSNAGTRVGDRIHYLLTATNRGPATATHLVISAFGASLVSGTESIPSLAPGASAVLGLDVSAVEPADPASGPPRVATFELLRVDQFDADTTRAVVEVPATAAEFALLAATTALSPGPITVGRTATARITVADIGNLPADGSTLRLSIAGQDPTADPYPTIRAVRISQGTAPSPTALASTDLVTASFGTIAPGASATLAVDFSSPLPETIALNLARGAGLVLRGVNPQIEAFAPPTTAVTNTLDSGPGSLRQAILDADSDPSGGVDPITFAIPGVGVHTIAPLSALPEVDRPVDLDATTQPGHAGSPSVVLDGSRAGRASGISLGPGSDGSTIRGLVIDRFQVDGITLNGTSRTAIRGNDVGVGPDGVTAAGNGNDGITDGGSLATSHNTIGGTAPGDGNVLSGNGNAGLFDGGDSSVVLGNRIGTDISGTIAVPNGVGLDLGLKDTIGGTAPGAGNLISGNRLGGIESFPRGGDGALIEGNAIGTDASGTHPLGNGGDGISIAGTQSVTIGGTTPGTGNLIASNAGDGIRVASARDPDNEVPNQVGSAGELIEGNAIGTDRSGRLDLGDGGDGVAFGSSTSGTIGGTATGAGNVIAHDRGRAIRPPADPVGFQGTIVAGNAIGAGSPVANIDVTVDAPDGRARYGDAIRDTFTVANRGPDAATHLRFQLVTTGGNYPVAIAPGPAEPEAGPGGFFDIAGLAAGASVTVVATSRAGNFNPFQPRTDLVGFTLVGLDQLDPDSTDNSASAPLDTQGLTGLRVAGSIAPGLPEVGARQAITFEVTDDGNGPASGVVLALVGLPPSAEVDAVRVSQGGGPAPGDFASGTTPFARLGTIGPGASASVTIEFTPEAPGPLAVVATPASSGRDVAPAATVRETVAPAPAMVDLAVAGLAPGVPVRVGSGAIFGFAVTNRGPGVATGAALVLDLAGLVGASFVEFQPGEGAIVPIPGRPGFYRASLGTIAPGATADVAFDALPTRTGPLVAVAGATADEVDPQPIDNFAFAGASAVPAAQVTSATLQSARGRVDAVRLTFDVPLTEAGAEDLRNYHLSTRVPAGPRGSKAVDVPLRLRSARYDGKHHEVLIRLAGPFPKFGTPIRVVVGGPGSVGLVGPDPILDPAILTIGGAGRGRPR